MEAPRNFTDEQKAVWNEHYIPRNKWYEENKPEGDALVSWMYQRYIKDYLRCIQSVDDSVGEVLDYLDETGMADNTVVIYSSDQGFYLGDYGWYDKRWMYEPSMRTPLMVRWPGVIEPGSRSSEMVQNLDYAQTFLDIAGATAPDDMQGESIVPIFRGENVRDWRDTLYYHYYEEGEHAVPKHCGVRTDRFKIIYYYNLNEWELYDIKNDPREKTNLYNKVEYATLQKNMKRLLRTTQIEYNDADGKHARF
jgi:arylsulfatase A-like enzyme